jgi:diaminopimelate decarboxylase/aspartate kinase
MADQALAPWVVLKFGGTSVANRARWDTIADLVRARRAEGLRPFVVCSAVAGVTNALEQLLQDAVAGRAGPALAALRERHLALGAELGVAAEALVAPELERLGRLAEGVALLGEASPRVQAQALAAGELMATRLGAAYLEDVGLAVDWFDARSGLTALEDRDAPATRRYLSAACDYVPDAALAARLAALPGEAVITQGFIARNAAGETVLLGRGGSDTSAVYFATKLMALRCELWSDVPGLYTADPKQVPEARLLAAVDYREAQEMASTGAKVIHPRCLLPAARQGLPLELHSTADPTRPGTSISVGAPDRGARVKAISSRRGITLVSMETPGMWQQVGFLADIFSVFKRHGLSIDLVSTSEMNVTVSLDPAANELDQGALDAVIADLAPYCTARVIGACASVTLVGRNIRGVLPHLGPALEVFEEKKIHLVSQAASDLNLTLVVDEREADRLVRRLHDLLFADPDTDSGVVQAGRELEAGSTVAARSKAAPWWVVRREEILALAAERGPLYIYDAETLDASAAALRTLPAVDRICYSVKANAHPEVLRRFAAAGLGMECVSLAEVEHVLAVCPGLAPERVLFTPNFAPRLEYERALAAGARVTVDNASILETWSELFREREIFFRLDPGQGRGHHRHVRTGGAHSKFGIPVSELDAARALADRIGARVKGLHAHAGSGILAAKHWHSTALFLADAAVRFPEATILDLGGGFGVPYRPSENPLNLASVGKSLAAVAALYPRFSFWIEPGRYLVAPAGVLVARVTQVKQKGNVTYVGVETGMNSLIRPALYGAWHEIVNLSRWGEPTTLVADVVGPICETGDVLGHARRIAPTREGDVLLVATAGAYGRVMSSEYNRRAPAAEVVLPPR